MTTNDKSQHPESRWVPKVFQLSLTLSKKFVKSNSPFIMLISMKEGYMLPAMHSCFSIVNMNQDAIGVKVSVSTPDSITNHISFNTTSPAEEVNKTSSTLNMSISLKCKVTAKLDGERVIFFITAPNESVEKMIKQHSSLFKNK